MIPVNIRRIWENGVVNPDCGKLGLPLHVFPKPIVDYQSYCQLSISVCFFVRGYLFLGFGVGIEKKQSRHHPSQGVFSF